MSKQWSVYLSGEIHSDWRERVMDGCAQKELPVTFAGPVVDHGASDAAGDILGLANDGFWRDHASSKVNAIRTRTLIDQADIAVIRFGAKYKQWNAAFDAGYCAATATPYITLHDADIIHPLKEVDAAAMAWAQEPNQVVDLLAYVTQN